MVSPRLTKKLGLSIPEMRMRSTDYFFSKDTMKVWRKTKLTAKYDKKTGRNYIKVVHPQSEGGRTSWYGFNKDGKTSYLPEREVPTRWRNKSLKSRRRGT